jgi:hypothetical protein
LPGFSKETELIGYNADMKEEIDCGNWLIGWNPRCHMACHCLGNDSGNSLQSPKVQNPRTPRPKSWRRQMSQLRRGREIHFFSDFLFSSGPTGLGDTYPHGAQSSDSNSVSVFVLAILIFELRASPLLGKHSIT